MPATATFFLSGRTRLAARFERYGRQRGRRLADAVRHSSQVFALLKAMAKVVCRRLDVACYLLQRLVFLCLCAKASGILPSQARAQVVDKIGIDISTSRGTNPIYKQNEAIELQVTPNRSVFLYCYYREKQRVYQIYPNRFRATNFVESGTTVQIPGKESNFSISFEAKNTVEAFRCFGFDRDIGNDLPPSLKVDLAPLPISSLVGLHRVLLNVSKVKPIIGMMSVIIE